jgi:hypothetical protein
MLFAAVLYGGAAALSVYAHQFGAFVVIAHAFSLALLPRGQRPPLRQLGAGFGTAAALLVPLGLYVVDGKTTSLSWVSKPTLRDLGGALEDLSGGGGALLPGVGKILLVAYLAVAALAVARVVHLRRTGAVTEMWAYEFTLAWLLVPVLGPYVRLPFEYYATAPEGPSRVVNFGLFSATVGAIRPRGRRIATP